MGNKFPGTIEFGRFCSIAKTVSVFAQSDHDMNRFTSSPISNFTGAFERPGDGQYGFVPLAIGAEQSKGFEPVHWTEHQAPVIVGNDVWIGEDVLIKPGVHIGDGAVVGARSVLTHDVAPYTVVAGNPARPRKKRFSEEVVERLQELAWWQYPYWELDGVKGDMPIEAFIDQVQKLREEGRISPYRPEPLTAQMLLEAAD